MENDEFPTLLRVLIIFSVVFSFDFVGSYISKKEKKLKEWVFWADTWMFGFYIGAIYTRYINYFSAIAFWWIFAFARLIVWLLVKKVKE